jgi:hypothetical protein
MANYVKATNFTAKDSLPSGNSGKIIKGAEIDTEFTSIASAIASKSDINSPSFTGTPVAPTAGSGTNTTQIATTAFVTAATVTERTTTATLTNKTLTSPTINTPTIANASISGGSISGITDLAVVDGGTGASTAADARTNLGVTATGADTTYANRANNLSDLASASSARTNLGLGTIATQNSASVSISGGSITGITDLAVADGGTGRSTLAANAVLLGNGTSGINSVAPSTSGNVLTSNGTTWTSATPASVKGLGIGGEVWNNVTGSRGFNTQYTNSRSYPIAVSASTTCSTGARITAYVNGVQIAYYGWQFNGCGAYGGTFIIVPAGATYQLNAGEGVQNWMELY